MNQSYYNKLNDSQTPRKNKQHNISQPQSNVGKYLRNSTDNKKNDSFMNMLLFQQQYAIQTARQLSFDRSLKKSPQQIQPYLQKNEDIVSTSFSQNRNSTEQGFPQFDNLLNQKSSLLMKIQELEQKMKCQYSRIQDATINKIEKQNDDTHQILEANQKYKNENRILKQLITRQTFLMHIPSVLQTLSLTK